MKNLFSPFPNRFRAAAILAVAVLALSGRSALADDTAKQPLELKLPEPSLKGTPEDGPPKDPNVEPIPDKPPVFLVPKGVTNVALHKPVTSSVAPTTGELSQITDGKKEATDEDTVEMKRGSQWVQVDLGASVPIYAIVVWHDHRFIQIIKDVVIEVSDDPEFKKDVTILFNNDRENILGLGAGHDRNYFETPRGKIIDARGIKARYVRGYSHGSSSGGMNCWEEIEVYALPGK
jgi:hypothetical protein